MNLLDISCQFLFDSFIKLIGMDNQDLNVKQFRCNFIRNLVYVSLYSFVLISNWNFRDKEWCLRMDDKI